MEASGWFLQRQELRSLRFSGIARPLPAHLGGKACAAKGQSLRSRSIAKQRSWKQSDNTAPDALGTLGQAKSAGRCP